MLTIHSSTRLCYQKLIAISNLSLFNTPLIISLNKVRRIHHLYANISSDFDFIINISLYVLRIIEDR